MPEVRLLAPFTDKDGNNYASGEIVDFDADTVKGLRADGKASLIADEDAAQKRAAEGNFSARTDRADAGHVAKEEKAKEKK